MVVVNIFEDTWVVSEAGSKWAYEFVDKERRKEIEPRKDMERSVLGVHMAWLRCEEDGLAWMI